MCRTTSAPTSTTSTTATTEPGGPDISLPDIPSDVTEPESTVPDPSEPRRTRSPAATRRRAASPRPTSRRPSCRPASPRSRRRAWLSGMFATLDPAAHRLAGHRRRVPGRPRGHEPVPGHRPRPAPREGDPVTDDVAAARAGGLAGNGLAGAAGDAGRAHRAVGLRVRAARPRRVRAQPRAVRLPARRCDDRRRVRGRRSPSCRSPRCGSSSSSAPSPTGWSDRSCTSPSWPSCSASSPCGCSSVGSGSPVRCSRVLAVALSAGATYLFVRFVVVRQWARYASLATVAFLLLFLFASPVTDIVRRRRGHGVRARRSATPPAS